VKKLLELKEWAELRDNASLEKVNGELNENLIELKVQKLRKWQGNLENHNRKLCELRISELYNLRYREEKEDYLRNLEAHKACYNILNSR
jgi:hypothetical protein